MPRRRLDSPADKRSVAVGVRLSLAEKAEVERMAKDAGMTPAEFARQRVLTGRVVVKQSRQMAPTIYRDLARVGSNLNQLVRWINAGGVNNPKALDDVADEGRAILARISAMLAGELEE